MIDLGCNYGLNTTETGIVPGSNFTNEVFSYFDYNSTTTFSIAHIPGGVEKFIPKKVCKEQFRKIVKACSKKVDGVKGLYGGCVNSEKYGYQACLTTSNYGYFTNSTGYNYTKV